MDGYAPIAVQEQLIRYWFAQGRPAEIVAPPAADLVVLAPNPLDNIAGIRSARFVVANGALYDCARLWRAAEYR